MGKKEIHYPVPGTRRPGLDSMSAPFALLWVPRKKNEMWKNICSGELLAQWGKRNQVTNLGKRNYFFGDLSTPRCDNGDTPVTRVALLAPGEGRQATMCQHLSLCS